MTTAVVYWRKFVRAERGATAIEYGFLLALIAMTLIAAFTILGDSVSALFGGITSEVSTAELIAGGDLGNCGDGSGDGSAECDNK